MPTYLLHFLPPTQPPRRSHPGNLLVRPRPSDQSKPQLVLLDHGLYRELPSRFTLLYARLWRSILLADPDGIRSVSHELGVGEYYPLLAAMLTGRPWGDILRSASDPSRLQERGTDEDKAQIRGYAAQYLVQIVHVLERVPPPMLLIFKCNDCLRHAERRLGGAGAYSVLVTLRYCIQTLLADAVAAADAADAVGAGHRGRGATLCSRRRALGCAGCAYEWPRGCCAA